LIGVGVTDLRPGDEADPPDLADPAMQKRKSIEAAMGTIRGRLGSGAIMTGRSLPEPRPEKPRESTPQVNHGRRR
jgi:DNA polymerase IV